MDRDKAADRLRHLATHSAERSTSAQLEDLFDEIKGALEAGVSQATILKEFRDMGFDVDPRTFRRTMRRLLTCRPETTAGMLLQQASTRTRFADTGSGAGPSTTIRGSLYDVEALNRLLLASAH